jgi:urea transport system ATP-binding protein
MIASAIGNRLALRSQAMSWYRGRTMSLLEVNQLTTKVSGYTILNNLNFSIEKNELRVLLGPNGAGKTTLMAMITGQFKPTSGKIVFDGRDITGLAPDDIFLAGISRKFQVPNMYETLSVYNNVMVSLAGDRKVFKYLFKRITPAENDRIWEILEFVDLAERANDPADTGDCNVGCLASKIAPPRRAYDGDDGRRQAANCRSHSSDCQEPYCSSRRARYACRKANRA